MPLAEQIILLRLSIFDTVEALILNFQFSEFIVKFYTFRYLFLARKLN